MRSWSRSCLAALVLFTLCACASPAPPPPAPPARTTDTAWSHEWARGAVFYEVFVRSFADSNGDGKGDLNGLIAKLDYLNDGNPATTTDLGVDALWLMPVFASPSYHGYDTTDYGTINPDYGTNADFERLCREAHKRGIKVVLDLVMNHTSDKHPWFVDSASSPRSAHRDWYVWRPDNPGWKQPWGNGDTWHERNGAFYYGIFWGGMPDLNYRNPAVRDEMKRIAKLWLDRGADGFRLDAARHIVEDGPGPAQNDTPETHAFWTDFSAYVRGLRPDAVLVGENWTDTPIIATYYGDVARVPGGDQLPMNFDFPLAGAIIESAGHGDASAVAAKIEEVTRTYPKGVIDTPFLTNHDMKRVASVLVDPGALRSAAAILLTLPGAPFVYYGEEIGMQNGPTNDDRDKRTPMPWTGGPTGGFTTGTPWYAFAPGHETANVAAEEKDPASLLHWYRDLVRARHASDALRHGDITLVPGVPPSVLAFTRASAGERVFVVHNLGGEAVTIPGPGTLAAPVFTSPGVSVDAQREITLPAHGTGIWRM